MGGRNAKPNPCGTAPALLCGERTGGGGPVRDPAGDLHGGGRGLLGLRGGRGRRRRPGRPLRLLHTTTRSPGTRTRTGREASAPSRSISTAADGAMLGLRGGRGRRRRPGRPLRVRTATTRSPGTRTRTARGASGASRSSPRRRTGPVSVFAADVDGDGDLDVLSASAYDDKIAWYENTDGAGSFGSAAGHLHGGGRCPTRSSRRTWTATATWTSSPPRTDDDKIAWYENTDGAGSFGGPAGHHHGGGRRPLGLRGGRGRRRRSGRPLGVVRRTTRSPGTRTRTARAASAPSRSSPRRRTAPARSSRRTWTATATWTSSPPPWRDDKIAWYENTDGAGSFGTPAGHLHGGGRRPVGLRGGRGRRRRPGRPLRLV